MGSLVRGLVLLSLVAAACAASVEWHTVKEPEHHVAAAKLAKVGSPYPANLAVLLGSGGKELSIIR